MFPPCNCPDDPDPPGPDPEVWTPTTMTVGDSGDWIGFSSGDIPSPPFNPPVGTISAEPNAQHSMMALWQDLGTDGVTVIFHGEIDAQGLRIRVGHAQTGMSIATQMIGGNTEITFVPAPTLEDGESYDVSFHRL